jgi:hypothetical protein
MLPRFSRLKGAPTKPLDCNLVSVVNQELIIRSRNKDDTYFRTDPKGFQNL